MAGYQPGSPITRAHLSSVAMVQGNEKHIKRVNLDGRAMDWVGFGWIDTTDSTTPAELRKLPEVVA